MWERIQSEIEIIPNAEALKLHWMRCCWVYTFWSQAYANVLDLPPLTDYGWEISDNKLKFVWDTDANFHKQEHTVNWYNKGCACKTGCLTNRCSCRKSLSGTCGPGCKCTNCSNLIDLVVDQNDSIDQDISFVDPETDDCDMDGIDADDLDAAVYEADILSYWETMNEIDF